MAKFNRNEISKERECENSGGALLSRPSGSEKNLDRKQGDSL